MRGPADRRGGFTLVELLIVLVVTGMVSAALARVFVSQVRSYRGHDETMQAVLEARTGLDLIVREARQAGFDPRAVAGAGLTHMTPDSVGWTTDLDADGRIGGSGPEGDEAVLYFLDAAAGTLVRRSERGDEPIVRGVESMELSYLDRLGRPAHRPGAVAQLRIRLHFRTVDGSPGSDLRTGAAMPNLGYRWEP